ncbi:hypothetical protein [Candidatus Methanomassiliicoccus intestinalis]|uniref:hypothetical protein n=1 Tax=Candidatus Methanomassiliicoccus intestinalis TaxID=1406512 RepID=UPI0037DCA5D2
MIYILFIVLAALFGWIIKQLKGKNALYGEQGDIILQAVLDLAKNSNNQYAIEIAGKLKQAWNDEKISTEDMQAIYNDLKLLLQQN